MTAKMPTQDFGDVTSQDIEGCRILLVEIVRRAAFDWVTYRDSTRIDRKIIAKDAFNWIFKEGPGHPNWSEQKMFPLFSFLGICDVLGLDHDYVRACIRKLTYQRIQSSGRPKTLRRLPREESIHGVGGYDFLLNADIRFSDLEDDFPPLPAANGY